MIDVGYTPEFARAFVAESAQAYRAVLETSIRLAQHFADTHFVLRPHPFENIRSYDRLAELPNAHVIQDGTSLEWINGARLLIHQNCSTALEAAMLQVEPLSMEWFNTPSLRLEFKPQEMDETITQFTLDFDGQIVKYAHGPQIPTAIQWPGPKGSTQVRVQLQPALAIGSSGMTTEGPWALFRLFDKLQLVPGGAPERFKVTFAVDGRKATFEVTASSVVNPFRLRELSEFACPHSL